MKKILSLISLTLATHIAPNAEAQTSLYEGFRDPNANTVRAFIFVSTKLPDATLIALARDSRRAGVGLVLNGYVNNGPRGLEDTKSRVADINRACCGEGVANWQINPLLFQRYKINAVPAFVIAKGSGDKPNDYSKISGEMSLGNALKFFAQESAIPEIKKKSAEVYYRTFSDPR
ncbi:type-F conjugative transfer system pilin assembly protein TrbC [Herbaspirillum huttiense]|uniref:type-F conjugative transfer system pilin assembly protein TrbC n=1 Tax=Herbaspirillum huttiense TaxID=863372 RepID=UPI002176AC13|nr:type-F conjugative transfer system pilin assembly protein TrbC [Herbaspirillum huttiense]UWE19361.1 type-F conjugative transfer system pilin assembly protein TrbC [Herbaspirillum huttiense]